MKKLLLLFPFSFALTFSVKAQTSVYHPFPDSDAVWRVDWNDNMGCNFTRTLDAAYQYYFTGDTIINSLSYHKIYSSGWVFVSGCCYYGHLGYQGAIRQDTVLRSVYIVLEDSLNELLLYDFSLSVGDTLHSIFTCDQTPVIVNSIDSVLVGTAYRKRWNLKANALNPLPLIEGIGSVTGPIEKDICPFECWASLICFHYNTDTLWSYYSPYGCNDVISSVNNLSEKNIFITLSPNPFHTTATLEIKNEELKIKNWELRIYDVMGRVVQQQMIIPKESGQSTIISRDGFGDGLYFYQLLRRSPSDETTNYELMLTGKFVVE